MSDAAEDLAPETLFEVPSIMSAGQRVERHHLVDGLVVLHLDVVGRQELVNVISNPDPVPREQRLFRDLDVVDERSVQAPPIDDSPADCDQDGVSPADAVSSGAFGFVELRITAINELLAGDF